MQCMSCNHQKFTDYLQIFRDFLWKAEFSRARAFSHFVEFFSSRCKRRKKKCCARAWLDKTEKFSVSIRKQLKHVVRSSSVDKISKGFLWWFSRKYIKMEWFLIDCQKLKKKKRWWVKIFLMMITWCEKDRVE